MSAYSLKLVSFLRTADFPLLTLLVVDLTTKAGSGRTKALPGVSVGHLERALEVGFNQAPRWSRHGI